MAAGRPRAARSVPAGVSRRNAGRPRTSADDDEQPPRRAAHRSARRPTAGPGEDEGEREPPPGGGPTRAPPRPARAPAPGRRSHGRQGHRPGEHDQRQQAEEDDPPADVSATPPASAGPMTPGSTHAVESVANIRGRRRSGSARPIAT